MERIDSSANKKLKLIGKLHSAKYRKQENLFVAEGVRLLEMAVESSWAENIQFALVTDTALQDERVQNLVEKINKINCQVLATTDELYKKATATVSPQGVLAVIEPKITAVEKLPELMKNENALIAVLDGIQDPGNAGTIIRTADAAGFSAVICMENTVDVLGDKTVRSSMGSLFNIPIVTGVNSEMLLQGSNECDVQLLATALDRTAVTHFAADYKKATAIIFGNEGNGVSEELLSKADQKIFIPMAGKAESLNVSVAAAIVIYEAYRQRGQ